MIKAKSKEETVEIIALRYQPIKLRIIGKSPLLMHRFSDKSRQQLLMPGPKQNTAGLRSTMKHNPVREFEQCLYRNKSEGEPTLFHIPHGMVRQAIASAALDMPGGANKTKILRWIEVAPQINLFGIPKLHMRMVRSSGVTHAPDVRTRPCFGEWACTITVDIPVGKLTEKGLITLVGGAGHLCGLGDWRPQRGGDYGRFEGVGPATEADFARIVLKQGKETQQAALESPDVFDEETEELLTWFNKEVDKRGLSGNLDECDMSGEPDAYDVGAEESVEEGVSVQ